MRSSPFVQTPAKPEYFRGNISCNSGHFVGPPRPGRAFDPTLPVTYRRSHAGLPKGHYYSRQSVKDVPSIAKRFLRLSPVLVGRVPSDEVSLYLREATQTFIHGFFQASTALSRAALEAGINEHLKVQLGSVPNAELVAKIDQLVRFKAIKADVAREGHLVRA